MTLYAMLDDAKRAAKATTTTDDAIMLNNLRVVSRRLDRLFDSRRPYFAPFIETRHFRLDPNRIYSYDYTYRLPDKFVGGDGCQVGDDTLTVGTTVEGWPTIESPFRYLRLMNKPTGTGTAPAIMSRC